MGEAVGKITFINTDDYTSDVDGKHYAGCTASLTNDDGTEVVVYTESMRLQHTIEMAFAVGCEVTVDYVDVETLVGYQRLRGRRSIDGDPSSNTVGAFEVNAIWTMP
jgi:hypothetical protein